MKQFCYWRTEKKKITFFLKLKAWVRLNPELLWTACFIPLLFTLHAHACIQSHACRQASVLLCFFFFSLFSLLNPLLTLTLDQAVDLISMLHIQAAQLPALNPASNWFAVCQSLQILVMLSVSAPLSSFFHPPFTPTFPLAHILHFGDVFRRSAEGLNSLKQGRWAQTSFFLKTQQG